MIDWFTVIAQIINFLILVGLLKYFLYGRILQAIEDRNQAIVAQRDSAQQLLSQAQAELEAAKEKNRQLDRQKEALLAEVRTEIEAFRQQQLTRVRSEIESTKARWSESLREQERAFLRDLKKRTLDSVCSIARRALDDLANVSVESQIVARFLERLSNLDATSRQTLVRSLAEANQSTVIQTTRELPDELKQTLIARLEDELQVKLEVRFETTEDLGCGIAMQTDAHKLGWNLRDYLTDLEQEMRTLIEEQADRTKRSNRKPEGDRIES